MKLIDLLVQELPKRGGWPAGASICERFLHESNIDFYDEKGNWPEDCGIKYGFSFAEKLVQPRRYGKGPCTEVVKKEEYEAVLAASKQPENNVDAWIEWSGGRCPVEQGTLVDVQYRDGKILCRIPANKTHPGMRDAQAAFWRNEARENDIVAYRLSESEKWNGEGLPPVGEVIEYSCIFFNPNRPAIEKGQWYKGTVIAYYDDCVWTSDNGIRPLDNTQFRPIRTDAERKRDEAGLAIYNSINWNAEGELASPSRMEDYRKAYDAIAAGKIPGIKLDD